MSELRFEPLSNALTYYFRACAMLAETREAVNTGIVSDELAHELDAEADNARAQLMQLAESVVDMGQERLLQQVIEAGDNIRSRPLQSQLSTHSAVEYFTSAAALFSNLVPLPR